MFCLEGSTATLQVCVTCNGLPNSTSLPSGDCISCHGNTSCSRDEIWSVRYCAGAAAALCNLAEGSPDIQAAICQADALDKFPPLLQGGLTSGGLIIEVLFLSVPQDTFDNLGSAACLSRQLPFCTVCPGLLITGFGSTDPF